MNDAFVHLDSVNHTWPISGTQACRNAGFSLKAGSVHALVGENAAGKTTLAHILAGVRVPDSGRLVHQGRIIDLAALKGALIPGIGLIRQRNIWPGTLTVKEAVILGRDRRVGKLLESTAQRWGLSGVDVLRRVSRMDAPGLQQAELMAALIDDPDLLILDEPAQVWGEGRDEEFLHLIGKLKAAGKAVLLITHRLSDIFRMADSITVMRRGRVVLDVPIEETDAKAVALAMFGQEEPGLSMEKPPSPPNLSAKPPILEVRDLTVEHKGRKELNKVSFAVSPGEILGITGLGEEGLLCLEDAVSGNCPPTRGTILVYGRPVPGGAAGFRKAGLHYVPSNQTGRGASLESTVGENLIVLEARRLARRGWLTSQAVYRWARRRNRSIDIVGEPHQKMEELSGGNIQKVILQREIHSGVRLLVLADPTRGLDERSRRGIHHRLQKIANQGASILLLATDLDEALELSDRLGIITAGQLLEIRATADWNRSEMTRLIACGGMN